MNLCWIYLKCSSDAVLDWIPPRVPEEQSSLKDNLLTFSSFRHHRHFQFPSSPFFLPLKQCLFPLQNGAKQGNYESSEKSNSSRWLLMVISLHCLLPPCWSLADFGIWRTTGTCLGSSLGAHEATGKTSFVWMLFAFPKHCKSNIVAYCLSWSQHIEC